jgi:hypothetical protein
VLGARGDRVLVRFEDDSELLAAPEELAALDDEVRLVLSAGQQGLGI